MGAIMRTRRSLVLASAMLAVTVAAANPMPPEEEGDGNSWSAEDASAIRSSQSPIPLQAAVCDIVGVGIVTGMSTNGWGDVVDLAVDHYWIGNPGSNTLSVSASRSSLTVTNTPIVFFATSYVLPHFHSVSEPRFTLLFKMPEFRQGKESHEPWFYDNERSWFFATPENADLVAFASNLVTAAQVLTNRLDYYELVRDGYRLSPPSSRIRFDSEVTFISCRHWMPTNFMAQVWSDPLLPGKLSNIINNYYHGKTGHWLP